MKNDKKLALDLSKTTGLEVFNNPEIAHVFIHHHETVSTHVLPGLMISTEEKKDKIWVKLVVEKDVKIKHPVHMCFGMIPRRGEQKLVINTEIKEGAKVDIIAHCVFPNAEKIRHVMDAEIKIGRNASYTYLERHIHGDSGGVEVMSKAKIFLDKNSRFHSEFELLKGHAGLINIDYEAECGENSVMKMITKINATGDDRVNIKETGYLKGDNSRGFLNSRIAARQQAKAEVYNKLVASGSYAQGHVDCKEIIKDDAMVSAVPIVEVNNPKAHITHEASLGSVDSKQLQTLMARGLNEEDATDLIINGLLS